MEWPPTYDPTYLPDGPASIGTRAWRPWTRATGTASSWKSCGAQVRYAHAHSAFYRELYRDAPVDPENLASFDEFRRLPNLTKEHLRVEQERYRTFGRFLCIPRSRCSASTHVGTTGRPIVFGIGRDDWERIAEAHARVLWSVGLRPGDCVMVAAVFSLYIGSWGALVGAERLGARCFPFGAGAPGPNGAGRRMGNDAKTLGPLRHPVLRPLPGGGSAGMGVDPRRDLGFRVMFFSGEPGASVPATRDRIRDTFGCHVVDQGTMAEMTPWMSSSGCRHLERGMHLWTDIVFTEMLDPDTREPVPPGGEGVPVYTHLERTSQPLVRYCPGTWPGGTWSPVPAAGHIPPSPRASMAVWTT